ncbi:carboxypeptidase-like regulatory domain-containing protein [Mucilaginibacter terrenus]|nr:carboxypeptidase-like regulatory domain-containing protein [Mucilaginibacter terrenus]
MAQNGLIIGKLTSAVTKSAVANASVFLSNASYGTASAEDGSFTLRGVKPGQYNLVVTVIGFEEYSKEVLVGSGPINMQIELTPKVMMMRQVTIISNADWKKNYEQFKKEFIGVNDNAKLCKVVNPRVLDLVYFRKKQTLEASSDEFLIVENAALGYRTKFLLNSFSSDGISHTIYYSGKALFEDLPGSEAQKKKWKAKREEAYYGSPQHFYRSLYRNKLASEGFVMYNYTREPNPNRPPEELVLRKLKQYREVNRDSALYWYNQQQVPKWWHENLIKPPLTSSNVVRSTPSEGIFAITFPAYLYVVYTKKHEEEQFRDIYRPLDMENFETSVITLNSKHYAIFDMNGIVVAESPLYEGTWSKAKLANMLPVDYEPGD